MGGTGGSGRQGTSGTGELRSVGLTETTLKLIACAAMLCDHAAAALVRVHPAYEIMREVGRIAFPLFCLGIVEGARHTHDWRRYLARLLVMGAVSELPADLALVAPFGGDWLSWQNVMWELAAALVAVRACMAVRERAQSRWGAAALMWLVTVGIAIFADWARLDYGFEGIVLVVMLWALVEQPVLRALAPAVPLASELPWVLGASALIALYDGRRGNTRHLWLFYLFYPAHLAVLALLRALL